MLELIVGGAAYFLAIHSLLFGFKSPSGIITSLFLTLLVYLPHEMGHMIHGGKYRIYPIGIVVSLLATYLRIPFILVGYVDTKREIDALTGPLMNLAIALSGLIVSQFYPNAIVVVYPSVVFALSNLLPIPPLDGYAIFRWKKSVWAILFVTLLLCA